MVEKLKHLKLPIFKDKVERQKRGGGGGYSFPSGRSKNTFAQQASQKADELTNIYSELKQKYSGEIDPSLIYEIEINQAVSPEGFDKILSSMGIHVLSIAEGKKGFWIVFNDNDNLDAFKNRIADYGSGDGHKYDFFNAIESFQNIPIEKKIGQRLKDNPLCDAADFIDIELWKIADPKKMNILFNN